MSWEQLNITHLHLILETMKLLNHMNMNLLKHNNIPWSLYAEKHEMHMKQAWYDQAKMEFRNKPWLDQTSNHYKVVTTMLIHTWNEHLDIQANKLNANHLHAQYSTNAWVQTHIIYLKKSSIYKIYQSFKTIHELISLKQT